MAPKIGAILSYPLLLFTRRVLEPSPSLGLVLANRLDPGGLQYRPQLRLVLRQEGGVVL